MREEEKSLIRRATLGEIADSKDPQFRSERHKQLLAKFEELTKREKELMVKDEFDRIYTTAGASGMNAGTDRDFTVYFINVPANKLELWFWMESDRLANPVFREFYSERDVVHEERRLRTDSTPIGKFNEMFESMFWQSSPYGWPVVGWPSDLEGITREEALEYFAVNYAPNNLTAALVGDFEPAQATELAKRYFGRLKRGPRAPEPVRTREMPQLAEKRMAAYAETVPQARVRFHTVAEGHPDSFALSVLSSLLNGRTGRLYKSLVLEQQVANNACAGQNSLKYEGYFEMNGVAKPGRKPEEVEQALYKEIEKIQKDGRARAGVAEGEEPVRGEHLPRPAIELRPDGATAAARRQPRLGHDQHRPRALPGRHRRRHQARRRPLLQAREPHRRHLLHEEGRRRGGRRKTRRSSGLSDRRRRRSGSMRGMLAQAKPEQLKALLAQVEQQAGSAPAEKQKFFAVVKKMLEDRIKQLEGE